MSAVVLGVSASIVAGSIVINSQEALAKRIDDPTPRAYPTDSPRTYAGLLRIDANPHNDADSYAWGDNSLRVAVRFPIMGNRDDAVANDRMGTSFTLTNNGRLTAVTNTRTMVTSLLGNSNISEIVTKLQTQQQPILVSVSPNWGSKLPSVRDQIIRELESHLSKLARGNQGYAKVEALRVEGSNLYVKVLIRHKHRPSGIGVPYSLQTWVETRYNPLDSKSIEDRTKLCVRGPSVIGSPNLCVTAGEVRQIISAFL